jgi:ribosomal protein S18 acetylase RimI-like enzyme
VCVGNKVGAAADGIEETAVARGRPPDRPTTLAHGAADGSSAVQKLPNRVASPTGADHGQGTATESSSGQHGVASPVREAASEGRPEAQGDRQEHGQGDRRDPLQGDAAGAGPAVERPGDGQSAQPVAEASAPAAASAAPAVAEVPLRARCLEDPDAGPEQYKEACLSFDLGDERFSYVAKWLTDYTWRTGSKQTDRQSRSNRRKTLLFFDDGTDELVGFAAWRTFERSIGEEDQWVGEVRFLAVIPAARRKGVATQMWTTTREAVVESEHGSIRMLILIEVDADNSRARAAYEAWGFEYVDSYESDGKPYEVLLFQPADDDSPLPHE